jgi:ferredoxin--NADP+ reductase
MDASRYARLRLVERVDFTDDLALFRFRADAAVDFVPGQYATLGLKLAEQERPLLRPYSVVSAPGTDELEFFVERVEDGTLTPRLWNLPAGGEAWMRRKVVGRFVLDEACTTHVMAATVTGVGPYVSIVRAQVRALAEDALPGDPHRMLVLHGGSRSWELGSYRDELARLADAHDWLAYVPTVSRPWEDAGWMGEVGRVEEVFRKHADAAGFARPETAVYACGHPGMVARVMDLARRAGYNEAHVHEEKYFIERHPGSA